MLIGKVVRTIQVEPLPEEIPTALPYPEAGAALGAGGDENDAGMIPDRLGAIVAHRVWGDVLAFKPEIGILRESALLRSLNSTIWTPRERIEAKCTRLGGAPHDNCTCGIYALKTSGLPFQMTGMGVTGEVYLWGKVIDCEAGYRAQFAYPKNLTVVGDERMVKLLAEAYGVEVRYISAPAPILPQANPQPFAPQPLPYSASTPEAVAGALAAFLREKGPVELQAVGAGAVNQAVKAIASARGYVVRQDLGMCGPCFIRLH